MTARVADRLRSLRAEETMLRRTPCAECGHPYHDHGENLYGGARCWWPRIRRAGEKSCRCKSFVDAADMLLSVYTETQKDA